ncbi:DUF2927 domain-containing protein [Phaeovulum sp.]|uniref:DUF2927 domain-containing protein n=1 Tax=Phaeovulum sp. TaxID=2934796 RepID=UPI0039E248AA
MPAPEKALRRDHISPADAKYRLDRKYLLGAIDVAAYPVPSTREQRAAMYHIVLPIAVAAACRAKAVWSARRGRRRLVALLLACSLAACSTPQIDVPTARAQSATSALSVADLTAQLPLSGGITMSNAALARDFMELTFFLESGRALPRFTRFEGPVTVRIAGAAPANAGPDLARLVSRLRSEAGIDISVVTTAKSAITIEFVPKRQIKAQVPNAACFVVPNVTGWKDYRRAGRRANSDWTQLATRSHAAVFIPSDAAPQEVRDCLHEEISQALGPLNDLYRLPDSIWNDDNFHTVLTGYDMTMLRAYYAPELHSGLSPDEVFSRLPAIFARINPAGNSGGVLPPAGATPRAFVTAIEQALGPNATPARRRTAAFRAVQIATDHGWRDTRAGFAWFVLGRLSVRDAPEAALNAFVQAAAIYRATPGARIHAAHVDMQLAAFALANGRAEDAMALVNRSLDVAVTAENPAMMATLYMIRAEALQSLGHAAEARRARLDSGAWARYGFGSDAAVRKRSAEVAALANIDARQN